MSPNRSIHSVDMKWAWILRFLVVVLVGLAAYTVHRKRVVPPELNSATVHKIEQKLDGWVAAWRRIDPNFSVGHFKEVRRGKIRADVTYRISEIPHISDRKNLWVCSADKKNCVDTYLDLQFDENGELSEDVDGGVALIDENQQRWIRLLYCGTPCTFDEAIWISNSEFAVVGSSEFYPPSGEERCTEGSKCTYVAVVELFNLESNLHQTFESDEVNARPAAVRPRALR